jgi:hypothetical protein
MQYNGAHDVQGFLKRDNIFNNNPSNKNTQICAHGTSDVEFVGASIAKKMLFVQSEQKTYLMVEFPTIKSNKQTEKENENQIGMSEIFFVNKYKNGLSDKQQVLFCSISGNI